MMLFKLRDQRAQLRIPRIEELQLLGMSQCRRKIPLSRAIATSAVNTSWGCCRCTKSVAISSRAAGASAEVDIPVSVKFMFGKAEP
jgi:hypothetical protein